MARTYRQLHPDQRRALFRLVEARIPVGEIGTRLGRHPSTIYRELGRNRFRDGDRGFCGYFPLTAQDLDTVIGSGGSGCCRDRLFFRAGVRARAAGGAEVTHYAGIDVSLETSSICIVDGAGTIVRELKAESEPGALAAALTATELPFSRVGLEAGPMSQWLHAGLAEAGLPVVLVETRRLRAATKTMPVKTDRIDARAIAQVVRTGWFRAVHVKSELSQETRALLAARKLLVAKLRDVDNGVRGLLRGFGLKVGTVGERAFPRRARELAHSRPELAAVVEPLLQVREALLAGRERLHRLVLAAVRDEPTCRRLMTVPGVGPVTALTFCSAVDDPARFGRSRALGAHFGLTPRRYRSGETDRVGHISKQGDGLARQALYEAANVLLTRTSRWSALKAWGMSVARRAGMRRAKVAVARKLAVVLHRTWRDGTEFRRGRETAAA